LHRLDDTLAVLIEEQARSNATWKYVALFHVERAERCCVELSNVVVAALDVESIAHGSTIDFDVSYGEGSFFEYDGITGPEVTITLCLVDGASVFWAIFPDDYAACCTVSMRFEMQLNGVACVEVDIFRTDDTRR
jgi:hypothetical protein